jgi:hypothetical protein
MCVCAWSHSNICLSSQHRPHIDLASVKTAGRHLILTHTGEVFCASPRLEAIWWGGGEVWAVFTQGLLGGEWSGESSGLFIPRKRNRPLRGCWVGSVLSLGVVAERIPAGFRTLVVQPVGCHLIHCVIAVHFEFLWLVGVLLHWRKVSKVEFTLTYYSFLFRMWSEMVNVGIELLIKLFNVIEVAFLNCKYLRFIINRHHPSTNKPGIFLASKMECIRSRLYVLCMFDVSKNRDL